MARRSRFRLCSIKIRPFRRNVRARACQSKHLVLVLYSMNKSYVSDFPRELLELSAPTPKQVTFVSNYIAFKCSLFIYKIAELDPKTKTLSHRTPFPLITLHSLVDDPVFLAVYRVNNSPAIVDEFYTFNLMEIHIENRKKFQNL